MLVEHRALEARVRAHVFAYLLAQVAGVAVGREGVEAHPEGFPATERGVRHFCRERSDRREVADERVAGVQREGDPQQLLRALAHELVAIPRPLVELLPLQPVAFGEALDPDERLRPDALRTGVAAPQPARERR